MDLISNLPKAILHDIVTRLPEKDAARTSVLSKAWQDTWSTFPILVFDESRDVVRKLTLDQRDPQQIEDRMRRRNNFLNSVDNTMIRFHEQGLTIREFKLRMFDSDFQSISPRIDRWIELAVESGVEVLSILLHGTSVPLDKQYCLPPSVLKAKSLTKLVLVGQIKVNKAFLNHPFKFPSLRALSLCLHCLGNEQIVQNLISCCPLVEYITLMQGSVVESVNANGLTKSRLKSVSIHGLPKLKGVHVLGIQEVAVDSPSLEKFCYFPADCDNPCLFNLDNCRNLRELSLASSGSAIITNQLLLELFYKFRFLEKLELKNCTMSERIKISSVQLKVLNLYGDSTMEEVHIDAPNLYSCGYYGFDLTIPIISFVNFSSLLEFKAKFVIHSDLDFQKFRAFLRNIKPRNILASLDVGIYLRTDKVYVDEVENISVPPPTIKSLDLCVLSDSDTFCLPLVTGLLLSCCPVSISTKLDGSCRKTIIENLCEKLMGGNEERCYCRSRHSKCWWHGLKDVKVTCSSWKYVNVVIDCKTLLDALPTLPPDDEICFKLE